MDERCALFCVFATYTVHTERSLFPRWSTLPKTPQTKTRRQLSLSNRAYISKKTPFDDSSDEHPRNGRFPPFERETFCFWISQKRFASINFVDACEHAQIFATCSVMCCTIISEFEVYFPNCQTGDVGVYSLCALRTEAGEIHTSLKKGTMTPKNPSMYMCYCHKCEHVLQMWGYCSVLLTSSSSLGFVQRQGSFQHTRIIVRIFTFLYFRPVETLFKGTECHPKVIFVGKETLFTQGT